MREEEAKTKLCPLLSSHRVQVGVDDWQWTSPRCRGTDCMLWVADKPVFEKQGVGNTINGPKHEMVAVSCGHCGMIK